MHLPTLPDGAWSLIAALVGSGAILAAWKKIIWPCITFPARMLRFVETMLARGPQMDSMETTMVAMQSAIDQVQKEMAPNGGHSLRDAMNRVESNQHAQGLKSDRIEALARTTAQSVAAQIAMDATPILQFDHHGVCLAANRAWYELTGYSQNDALRYGWTNSIHPGDGPNIKRLWADSIREQSDFDGSFRIVTKSAGVVMVHFRCQWMRNDDGSPSAMFGTVTVLERVMAKPPLNRRKRGSDGAK